MQEFHELIKNFDKIRDYMRQFYVYGFKVRSDFDAKSARTYDNERRRIESWLGIIPVPAILQRESICISVWTAKPSPAIPFMPHGSPKPSRTTICCCISF